MPEGTGKDIPSLNMVDWRYIMRNKKLYDIAEIN